MYKARCASLTSFLCDLPVDRCYVSFSAGKDSSVLAHAASIAMPGVPILMVDPGCPTHWSEDERKAWKEYAAEAGWNIIMFPWDKWSDDDVRAARTARQHAFAAHRSMFSDLEQWASAHGRDHCLQGLRAEESRGRRVSLITHGDIYRKRDGSMVRVAPLARWTWMDIWAYIIDHDLPWLRIYDCLGPEARNGWIGRNGLEHGRMVYLRKYYPEAYRFARDILEVPYA